MVLCIVIFIIKDTRLSNEHLVLKHCIETPSMKLSLKQKFALKKRAVAMKNTVKIVDGKSNKSTQNSALNFKEAVVNFTVFIVNFKITTIPTPLSKTSTISVIEITGFAVVQVNY